MFSPSRKRALSLAVALASFLAASTLADEIRLKDVKKLYGVIVAFEDNMFKVKTDFGFVLVEKDKIATSKPSTWKGGKDEAQPAAKKSPLRSEKNTPTAEPAVASAGDAAPDAMIASAKAEAVEAMKPAKPELKITSRDVKPELPAKTATSGAVAPTIKDALAP